MKERWRSVLGFKGRYEVSSEGRVRGLIKYRNNRGQSIMKFRLSMTKYLTVNLKGVGCRPTKKVHRLVAESFIPNPEKKRCVNHKNGIKTDNRAINLEWCTYSENNRHALEFGLIIPKKGEESPMSKLTNAEVLEIYNSSGRHKDIANHYGVTSSVVGFIKVGRTWSHITGHIYVRRRAPNKKPHPRVRRGFVVDLRYGEGSSDRT